MALIFSVPAEDSRKLDAGESVDVKVNGGTRQVRKQGTSLTTVEKDGQQKQFNIDEAFPIVGSNGQDQMQFICSAEGQPQAVLVMPSLDDALADEGYFNENGQRLKMKAVHGHNGNYTSNRAAPDDCELFVNQTDMSLDVFYSSVVAGDRADLNQLEDVTFRVNEVGIVEGNCVATLKCTDERVNKPLIILTRYQDGLSEMAKVSLPSETLMANLMQQRFNLSFQPQSRAFVTESTDIPTDVDVLVFSTEEIEVDGEFSVAYLDNHIIALDRGTNGPKPHAVVCGANLVGQALNVGAKVCLGS